MTASIPSYPVIHVDVLADGSAHVNVAGRHVSYPAGPLTDTRAAVTRYAVEMALTLGRPVRMTTTDPAGTFRMAAHPDGTLTDLAAVDGKPKRRRRPQLEQTSAPATGAIAVMRPAAPAVPAASVPALASAPVGHDELEATRLAPHVPSAVLTFSNGQSVTVTGSTLVGRRPVALDDEVIDKIVTLEDTTSTVSKTHFRVDWHIHRLWIAARDTVNGVILERHGAIAVTLIARQPHELRHGDVLVIGEVTATVAIKDPQTEAPS